jgi:kynureninase
MGAGMERVELPGGLYGSPNALAPDYSRFDVGNRLLLTGHSHQAWPDRGFQGQVRAWEDAARLVDGKWTAAFERADRVRRGYARLLGEPDAEVALGQSTFELVTRFLSALPLADRPRLVTTDGEFHTIRRLLDRLAEAGVQVVKVAARPVDSTADRLAAAADDRTAAVLVSSVLFLDARIVPGLGRVAEACARVGAELLVDAYHHLNVVPFATADLGLAAAFITGGGYKYCQLGEGNAFLRVPPGSRLRPVLTGWFAEFAALTDGGADGRTRYGGGAARFAGATYDPTSHYRAAEVFDFLDEKGLTPALLREVSQHQVGLLADRFDAMDLDPAVIERDRAVTMEGVGGFLALRSPWAAELADRLRSRGVETDYRGDMLRLGPAPYLSDQQLTAAVGILGECVGGLVRSATPRHP